MISYHSLTEEDRLFLRKADNGAEAADRYRSPQFTKFISPHERVVFEQFASVPPFVSYMVWGGTADCERTVIGFFPDYMEPCEALFPISALQVKAAQKLGHREVLGSVLGLGIERSLLGDILPEETGAVLFCLDSIADFIRLNLRRVGRQNVTTDRADLSELILAPRETKEICGTVSSLRLDSVLALALGKSRAKTQEMIGAGLVQHNWSEEESPDCPMAEGDIVSVRGFGRLKLNRVLGETKKGRIRITVLQYI